MPDLNGKLRIRTYTAGGALPVRDALVKIQGADESNLDVAYTFITDEDGLTPEVELPAPSVEYSLSPNQKELPYSIYDIEISAPGYYTKHIKGLPVFPGVNSIQLVNMIPATENSADLYPIGSVNTIIPQNSNLY